MGARAHFRAKGGPDFWRMLGCCMTLYKLGFGVELNRDIAFLSPYTQ